MSYNPLTKESGGDEVARIEEAHQIVRMLEEVTDQMTPKEAGFVNSITDCDYCTTKQLFWLRDIKDKYL
jgi:hypothetical protein